LSIPLVEWAIPERYPRMDAVELIRSYGSDLTVTSSGEVVSTRQLISFAEDEPRAVIAYGQAFYPSFYEQGKYWGENSPLLIEASQYDRLQFNLMGSQDQFVYIPLETAPAYFPNASTVFVVGCREDHGVRALFVKVNDNLVASSFFEGLTCSE